MLRLPTARRSPRACWKSCRDRTGYPIETLGLDLDIEADLGIDSIKRVEILGKLRDEFPALKSTADSSEAMDALARARTLGAIVDRMAALAGPSHTDIPDSTEVPADQELKIQDSRFQHNLHTLTSESATVGPPFRTVESFESSILESNSRHDGRSPRVERRVLEAVAAPLPRHRRELMTGGRMVVTDDGRGVAAELAGRLEAAGVAVERLGNPERPVDWTSPSAIDAAVDDVRARGAIAGLVHAMPLGQPASGDPGGEGWSERIGEAVKGLFLLARSTAADLESAAGGGRILPDRGHRDGGSIRRRRRQGRGPFLPRTWRHRRAGQDARTRVADGPLPHRGPRAGRPGGHDGGPVWPTRCSPSRAGPKWATTAAGGSGSGRSSGRCCVHRAAIELTPGDPVVITGGARGITALVAAELARAWRPTLLIVGTTPEPTGPEPEDTAGPRRRGRAQGGDARAAPPRGPAGRPRRHRGPLPGIAPCPRGPREPRDPPPGRGHASNTPAPTSATRRPWPPSSTAGAADMATPSG